jgi:phage shock protein PspC (stress-responsive transcriptional regulator)/nitrate reductase NapAB chaperone NapD
MKKTFTINVSSIIFQVDDDAFEILQQYLSLINNRYAGSSEGKEIIADIEARIAELFNEKISDSKQVINIGDVNCVIDILGEPDEFEDDDTESQDSKKTKQRVITSGKRLFRDPDNRVIGGVCGGLGAYFSIDPVIFRIIFIFATLVYGSGPLIYLILWIAAPVAKSTAEKLQMRGENVTVSNIEKSISEEFTEVRNKFKNFKHTKQYSQSKNFFNQLLSITGNFLNIILKIVIITIGISFIVSGTIILFALVGGTVFDNSFFFPPAWGNFDYPPYEMFYVLADPTVVNLLFLGIILIIAIPVLAILYAGVKMIFKFKSNNKLIGLTALSLWLLGIILTIIVSVMAGKGFNSKASLSKNIYLKPDSADVIYLKMKPDTLYNSYEYIDQLIDFDELILTSSDSKRKFFIRPEFEIKKSSTANYEMEMRFRSRGDGKKDAIQNADHIIYNWSQKDSLILFEQYFTLPDDFLWRYQSLDITLKIPEGKSVYIEKSMDEIINEYNVKTPDWTRKIYNKKMIMDYDGLVEY